MCGDIEYEQARTAHGAGFQARGCALGARVHDIEKDGALERRFQKVMVEPTTPEETLQILNNIKDKYQDHHGVNYTDSALRACVSLTERFIISARANAASKPNL